MIQIGSIVQIADTDLSGRVIDLENNFVKIQTQHGIRWEKLASIVDPDDIFLEKHIKQNFSRLHDFVLTVDSHRLDVAKGDPISSASATRIDIYPHQLDAVIWALKHRRVMIADEVGLGKTISALLVIYELHTARKLIDRVLIIVPSPLTSKWKNELEKRFSMNATIINNAYLKINSNVFNAPKYIYIASIDFLKQSHILNTLPTLGIDCVVIDEAHKAKLGTSRHKLAQKISRATERLILLTATPHDGHNENFLSLMQLLYPDIDTPNIAQLYMIRNSKDNIINIDGKPVFPRRTSKTIDIELKGSESEIYHDLEQYLQNCNAAAKNHQERSAARFVSIIFRKRASSSIYSLLTSLKRRQKRLGEINADDVIKYAEDMQYEDNDLDDVEYDGDKHHNNLNVELYTARSSKKDELNDIATLISKIIQLNDKDSKFERLNTMIKMLRTNDKQARLIIFTEYRSTLDYLCERLSQYSIGTIHGGQPMSERERIREDFKNNKIGILICTDAAGEGIDMQFCNVEVNYDIPWNPNRLEQRMGRIHRIGQKRNVEYYNFVLHGDQIGADGYIHKLLLDKIDTIKTTLGDSVYDLFGQTYTQDQLADLYDQLTVLPYQKWKARVVPFTDEVAQKITDASNNMKQLLSANILNKLTPAKIKSAQKDSVDQTDVKRFIETLVLTCGGSITEITNNIYKIVPSSTLANPLNMTIVTGTYDKDLAESSGYQYLSLSDKDVDKMITHAQSNQPVSIIGHPTRDGTLFAYRLSAFDGNNDMHDEKIILIHCDNSGNTRIVDEKSIWDYTNTTSPPPSQPITSHLNNSRTVVNTFATGFKNKLDNEIKSHITQFNKFAMQESSKQVSDLEYNIRQIKNSKKWEPSHLEIIRDLENQKISIFQKWEKRKQEVASLSKTHCSSKLLGVAIIVPDANMMQNLHIDRCGMTAVLEFEHNRASNDGERNLIHDVSECSCGYDVESFGSRHIEVKSFSTTGNPSMTSNEWDTARRYGDDYWLYIVEDAETAPRIFTRQNPYNLYKDTVVLQEASSERWVIPSWKNP